MIAVQFKLPPVRPTKRRKHEHRHLQSLLIRRKVNCRQYRRGLDLWCVTDVQITEHNRTTTTCAPLS